MDNPNPNPILLLSKPKAPFQYRGIYKYLPHKNAYAAVEAVDTLVQTLTERHGCDMVKKNLLKGKWKVVVYVRDPENPTWVVSCRIKFRIYVEHDGRFTLETFVLGTSKVADDSPTFDIGGGTPSTRLAPPGDIPPPGGLPPTASILVTRQLIVPLMKSLTDYGADGAGGAGGGAGGAGGGGGAGE